MQHQTVPQTTEPQRPRQGSVIADHLEHIASLIRAAELGELPTGVHVFVNLFALGARDDTLATVDHLVKLTGQEPQWSGDGGKYGHYKTELRDGDAWSLDCYTFEKRPVSTEDQLRARVAELEAQLAEGGETR